MPRELSKVVLPVYTIEPPDILTIDAVNIVPKPPYRLRTFDLIGVEVLGTLPDSPISGVFLIEPGGLVKLGHRYGSVRVSGLTIDEAKIAIEQHLRQSLAEPSVLVTLAEMSAKQQIAGEHLVGPDGTVTLGSYGSVPVVGLTIAQAKLAIEAHLSQFLEAPEVSVNVFAYNSKVYYVVTQGAGMGDGVFRFPVTGNETVLDAISQINGLETVSSKRIWIARPTRDPGNVQILPVSWDGVTAQASTSTNYQVLPGDRVFIAEDKLVALDTSLAKIIAPLERVMGFSLLGAGTATRFSGPVLRGGGNRQSTF
ncbi:MAG: polysaccharide biosynthesis/export family protein [Pirellulales bacterium]|nr:polysaccharide biosynthesis/export family protein [Pirellulales bacterium]